MHVPDGPRFRLGADGEVQVAKPTKLSDYFVDRL